MTENEQRPAAVGDCYVAGQYAFNYLRAFLAAAGIDASTCKIVIELPDRNAQRQLVSALQRDSKGPPLSAAKIGNHLGRWQGVAYEIAFKEQQQITGATVDPIDMLLDADDIA